MEEDKLETIVEKITKVGRIINKTNEKITENKAFKIAGKISNYLTLGMFYLNTIISVIQNNTTSYQDYFNLPILPRNQIMNAYSIIVISAVPLIIKTFKSEKKFYDLKRDQDLINQINEINQDVEKIEKVPSNLLKKVKKVYQDLEDIKQTNQWVDNLNKRCDYLSNKIMGYMFTAANLLVCAPILIGGSICANTAGLPNSNLIPNITSNLMAMTAIYYNITKSSSNN